MKHLIKHAFTLSLLASTLLVGMEKITDSIELPQENLRALKRFPGYYYFVGSETEMAGRRDDYLKKGLHDCLDYLDLHQQNKHKIKVLNFCAALEVAAAVFLGRPLEEWSITDFQKMNALLVHNLSPLNENLGKFKTGYCIVSRENRTRNQMESLLYELHIPRGEHLDLKALTIEQLAHFDQHFVRTSNVKDVPEDMADYLETLKALAKNKEDVFKIASYAHIRLSQIHPFIDGNGKLARLVANCILMQKGYLTLLPPADFYKELVFKGDMDQNFFIKGLRLLSAKIEREMAAHRTDLEGSSLEEAQGDNDSIIEEFKAISLENKHFVREIGTLRDRILKKIGIITRRCTMCKKTEKHVRLFECSRCTNPFYCSPDCQKKHWPLHKNSCHPKK